MKLLVNKNCSGYHWFGCKLTGDEQYIKMYEEQSVNQVSSFLGGLRIYGQFEYCLIRDKGAYLLAINNLHEKERDVFGRPISIKMIFIGDENHAQLLLKILLTALEDFNSFSDRMNSCFASSSMSHPIYVRCDWEKLHAFIEEINARTLSATSKKVLENEKMNLIAVSKESLAMGKNGLGFNDSEINKAKAALALLDSDKYFLTTPPADSEQEVVSEIVPENNTIIERDSKTITADNIDTSHPDVMPIKSEKDDVSANKAEIVRESEKLKNEIAELKTGNSELQHRLETINLIHEQLKARHQKELRRYKGLLAGAGTLIITLIILYILK